MPVNMYAARYELRDYTTATRHGELVLVRCAITNAGSATWSRTGPHPVNLAYRWADASGRIVVGDGRHTELKRELEPGETIECELAIETPEGSGPHTLRIDMVAETLAWFGDIGSRALELEVEIEPTVPGLARVCLINTSLMRNDAVGNYIIEQIRYFRTRGHQVALLVEYIEPGAPLDIVRLAKAIHISELKTIDGRAPDTWAAQQFYGAELVVVHYPIYYYLAEAIRLVRGANILFDYHGVTPPELWNQADTAGLALLVQSQERTRLAKHADHIITHSSYTRQELRASSGLALENVTVVPYIVAVDQFAPDERDEDLVERYGLAGQRVLLYIGRMAGNKRIDTLVRVLALVRATHPNTVLLLVGNIEEPVYRQLRDEALVLAEELGCADRVIFTGSIAHSELPPIYNLADVYVTSSLHEGFCVPVVEAMACGKPVVASAVTALPETVGEAGLVFPPEDAAAMAAHVSAILGAP